MNKYTIKRGIGRVRLTTEQVKKVREFYRMKGTAGYAMFFAEAEAYPQGSGWYHVWSKDEGRIDHVRHAINKIQFALHHNAKAGVVHTPSQFSLPLPKRRIVKVVRGAREGKLIQLPVIRDHAKSAILNKENVLNEELRRTVAMRLLIVKWGKPQQHRAH